MSIEPLISSAEVSIVSRRISGENLREMPILGHAT